MNRWDLVNDEDANLLHLLGRLGGAWNVRNYFANRTRESYYQGGYGLRLWELFSRVERHNAVIVTQPSQVFIHFQVGKRTRQERTALVQAGFRYNPNYCAWVAPLSREVLARALALVPPGSPFVYRQVSTQKGESVK